MAGGDPVTLPGEPITGAEKCLQRPVPLKEWLKCTGNVTWHEVSPCFTSFHLRICLCILDSFWYIVQWWRLFPTLSKLLCELLAHASTDIHCVNTICKDPQNKYRVLSDWTRWNSSEKRLICLPGYDEPSEPSPNQSVRAYGLDSNQPHHVPSVL